MRTWSGRVRMMIEEIMPLSVTDLPDPVAPDTSRWGMVARLTIAGLARDVDTEGDAQRVRVGWASSERRMSPRVIRSRCRFGTSTPIADLPGIGATMRTSGAASA
jgi:hypothetical protein